MTPYPTTLSTILNSPRAIESTPKQLEYVLAQAMAKAYADMGIKAAERQDEITYLVQTMPAEVTRNLPNIRLDEIPIAINRGIMQQFGEFYGLNVVTFMRFLIAHHQSEQRQQAVKAHLAAATGVAERPTMPTARQIHQNRLNRMGTAFEHYKSQGYYNDYGSLVFDHINALGKIPFGPEKESQLLEQARQNLVNRHSRISLYPDERATLRATLNKIVHGEANSLIVTEAKRLALFELFDNLIETGVSILEWMNF
jgi:hypothetical protein